jgi:hypothetical protein
MVIVSTHSPPPRPTHTQVSHLTLAHRNATLARGKAVPGVMPVSARAVSKTSVVTLRRPGVGCVCCDVVTGAVVVCCYVCRCV